VSVADVLSITSTIAPPIILVCSNYPLGSRD